MRYPVSDPRDWRLLGRPSVLAMAAIALRSRRYRRRARVWRGVTIERISGAVDDAALSREDIVLLCVVKNGIRYLPSLLAHYRRLGVRRFAFVDDASKDGTSEFLSNQTDVDLYRSNVGFRQSDGGLVWRDLLVERYGRNRWYLSIDSDEYLVFPGCERRSIADFVAILERKKRTRVFAAMIDIYPDANLGAVQPDVQDDAFPTEICPMYDGADYSIAHEKFCTAIRGGPRHRLFGADMRLSKFPLLLADEKMQFSGGSHHGPLPLDRNFGAVGAVLLHFKFPDGAVEEFRKIADQGTHFGGSRYYREIVSHPSFGEDVDFRYAGSRRYEGSDKLVAEGFMQDLEG